MRILGIDPGYGITGFGLIEGARERRLPPDTRVNSPSPLYRVTIIIISL